MEAKDIFHHLLLPNTPAGALMHEMGIPLIIWMRLASRLLLKKKKGKEKLDPPRTHVTRQLGKKKERKELPLMTFRSSSFTTTHMTRDWTTSIGHRQSMNEILFF